MSQTAGGAMAALMELLKEANFAPRIQGARAALPVQFDMLYGVAVATCALYALAKEEGDIKGARTVNATLFKFGQFIAARPRLVPDYLAWREHLAAPRRLELEAWPLLPRGFLTDAVPDGVVAYLVAAGELERAGKSLRFIPDKRGNLATLHKAIEIADIFKAERKTLAVLADNMPTLASLGIQ